MWPFDSKKRVGKERLLAGGTDHHSHILPGVDDGVKTTEEALRILEHYATTGIKELWLTPHTMEDYPNTAAKLKEQFATFCEAYKGPITLHLATEYMLDNKFDHILKNEELLPIGKQGNHLLVETSYYTPPMRLHDTLQQIKSRGYFPLLAHAERYLYMEKKQYEELAEMGIKFQLNLPSLAGVYGPGVEKKALWLLNNGMYSVAGSDTHCSRAVEAIEGVALKTSLIEKLKKVIDTQV